MSFVGRSYFRKSEVYRARNAIEFDYFLALNVGAVRSEFPRKRWFNEGNPLCCSFRLVPRYRSAAVRALYDFTASFSTFAASA